MSSASYSSGSDRSRWRGIVLALIVEGLVALLLLSIGSGILHKVEQPRLTTFDVQPVGEKKTKQATRTKVASKRKTITKPSAAPPPPVAPPVPPIQAPAKLIQLSPDEFAASDIGKIKSAKGEGDDSGSGKDSVAAYGPGEGPGGSSMYPVEWYRGIEPSDAEMAPYLRDYYKGGEGHALIACRTIPGNRVENCRSLGESPAGSGLARAVRLAAWQFRISPPRVNGKPLIGGWVKIYFDMRVGFRK